jgi:hypothetical protein
MDGTVGAIKAMMTHGAPSDDVGVQVDRLLRRIADGQLTLQAIRHPLGFLCAQLDRRADSVLRLHLWPSRPQWKTLTTSPYHMHAWNLVSYVHTGRITNTMVEVQPDEDSPEYRVFQITGDANTDQLRPTEVLVRSSVVSTQTIPPGGLYRIDAGYYHASKADSAGWAVTVALVERVVGATERVLGPVSLGRHRTLRPVSPSGELLAAAQHVVSEMRGR